MANELMPILASILTGTLIAIGAIHYERSLDHGLARKKLVRLSFIAAVVLITCWTLYLTVQANSQESATSALNSGQSTSSFPLSDRLVGKSWAAKGLGCEDSVTFVRKKNVLLSYGSDNQISHQYVLMSQDGSSLIVSESGREVTFTFYSDGTFFYGDTFASGRFRPCLG